MAKEKLIFNGTKDYQTFLNIMLNEIAQANSLYFVQSNMPEVLASLKTSDKEKRKKYLDFVNYVDRKMNFGGQANKNSYHKIPTMLSGILYCDLFSDEIKDLSPDELEILAKHSAILPLSFYKQTIMYYTKQLLRTICDIGPDFMYRTDYMFLAEKYFDLGKTPEEIATYFHQADKDELLQEAFKYLNIRIEEGFKEEEKQHESRRF